MRMPHAGPAGVGQGDVGRVGLSRCARLPGQVERGRQRQQQRRDGSRPGRRKVAVRRGEPRRLDGDPQFRDGRAHSLRQPVELGAGGVAGARGGEPLCGICGGSPRLLELPPKERLLCVVSRSAIRTGDGRGPPGGRHVGNASSHPRQGQPRTYGAAYPRGVRFSDRCSRDLATPRGEARPRANRSKRAGFGGPSAGSPGPRCALP